MPFGKWSDAGVPHKGWVYESVYDVLEDSYDNPGENPILPICEMCEKEQIRYVHVVSHPEHPTALEVGCICASKMIGDYQSPREAEKNLKNRNARCATWIKNGWKKSAKGNLYRKVDGKLVTIYHNEEHGYKSVVESVFSRKYYPNIAAAKGDAFDRLHGLR